MSTGPDTTPTGSYGAAPTDELTCSATSEDGRLRCIKPLYRARNGEVWEHGGGHFFTTAAGARRLARGDYDAQIVLASLRRAVPDA
jgi:hypothetical protein